MTANQQIINIANLKNYLNNIPIAIKNNNNNYKNYKNKFFLLQNPKRIEIIQLLLLLVFISNLDLIYSSTEINNNTGILSDIYMQNILSKSHHKDLNSKENAKPLIESKLNRVTFEEISNYEKSKKEKEEALMNYYSEYISLIKEIVNDSDNQEEIAFEQQGDSRNSNFIVDSSELIETPLQMTKEDMKCIILGNKCGYELQISEDGKSVFRKKKPQNDQKASENANVNYYKNFQNNNNKKDYKSRTVKSKSAGESSNIINNNKRQQHKSTKNDKEKSFRTKEEIEFSNSNQKNNNNKKNKNYNINNNKDIYDEVISDLFKENQNSNKIFEFSLKSLYGNSTLLHFTIEDLENLIKYNYLSDGQAVLLWETLTILKTDRLKNLNLQSTSEANNTELYIFNLIPIKSTVLLVLNSGLIILGYNLFFSYKSKDRRDKPSYLLNIVIISLSLYSAENFYAWKYYLVCCQMLILFICALQCFMDSVYLRFGFAQEECSSFFGNYAKTKNSTQFLLKIINLFAVTGVIGVFTFSKFPHFYNYVLFYICLTKILNLISVFFQYEVPNIFQPFRHFVMISFGFLNFLMINFHKKNYFFSEYNSQKKLDSFYFLGDLYTFFCFFFLYDYLFMQANNMSNLFYEKILDKEKINFQISSIMKEQDSEKNKSFTSEDSLWILALFVGLLFQYVGIKSNKYLVFYFSFYYFKTLFSVFGKLFHVSYLRFIYNLFLFLFLITNHIISSKNDEVLFEVNYLN